MSVTPKEQLKRIRMKLFQHLYKMDTVDMSTSDMDIFNILSHEMIQNRMKK